MIMASSKHVRASMGLVMVIITFLSLMKISSAKHYPPVHPFISCLAGHHVEKPESIIIFPNTPTYTTVLNVSMKTPRFAEFATPAFILTPSTEAQIQACVVCCRDLKLHLRLLSGGHDYEGLSVASVQNLPTSSLPFVILDLVNFKSISVDVRSQTAWVQGGATIGELYYNIAKSSNTLGFPSGTWSPIGVGGIISGGGKGMMTRKFGLSSDNVIDARLVNAKGQILNRKSMGEDLFWAIRGGGGNTFGVILAWKIRLVVVPENVTIFNLLKWDKEEAINLVDKWQKIALDENLTLKPQFLYSPSAQSNRISDPVVVFTAQYLGSADKLMKIMKKNFPELGLNLTDCHEMTWIQSVLQYSAFPITSPLEVLLDRNRTDSSYYKKKSSIAVKPIPKEVFRGVWERIENQTRILVELTPFGGIMNRIGETETPFPHRRGSLYLLEIFLKWNTADVGPAKLSWARELDSFLGPHVSKGSYVNDRDLDLGVNANGPKTIYEMAKVWGERYFKGNFKKLALVKGKVDPHNFFWNEQSVTPLVI